MATSDPIADMLTRIRNANTAKHDTVDIPASKMKQAIAKILLDEGYVSAVETVKEGNFDVIRITLKYGKDKNEKVLRGLKRISKPGLRVYADTELEFMLTQRIFQRYLEEWVQQSSQQTRVCLQISRLVKRMLVVKFLHLSGKISFIG